MPKKFEIIKPKGMISNYRVMNTPSERQGNDYYQIVEVFYDGSFKPVLFTLPTLAAATHEELLLVMEQVLIAFEKSIIHEKDFRHEK